jgi:hypothetical protein
MSKSKAKREKHVMEEFMKVKPKQAVKRRAKPNVAAKIPGLSTGMEQEANGPFQDQEIVIERPPDKLKSGNSAPTAVTSSSEDSETDTVDVDSELEEYEVPPRDKLRAAVNDMTKEHHMVLTREQTKRQEQLDAADQKAKETAKPIEEIASSAVAAHVVQVDQVETMAADVVEKVKIDEEVVEKQEVVIVGVWRFMPVEEIAWQAYANKARRIEKRVEGKLQPTTAIILTYSDEPPEYVYIEEERFRTRPFIRQTTRCYHCQGFNHRQGGCKNKARCGRCGGSHSTNDCKVGKDVKLKCANCKGDHSAASPRCPKYMQVKEAWKTVAIDKVSYAEAMRKTTSKVFSPNPAISQHCSNTCNHVCRADAIETPASKSIDETFVPRVVRSKWAIIKKPSTNEMGTQTEDEPVDVAVQTCIDTATQTIEVIDESVQPYAESETQTPEIDTEKAAEEQYFMVTLLQIVGVMMPFFEGRRQVDEWDELVEKFNFIAGKMATRGYSIKTTAASRRGMRADSHSHSQQYYRPETSQRYNGPPAARS